MTQVTSAAKAGFTERTGRTYEKGLAPSRREKKQWRRRPDPFAGVWDEVLVPLLQESPFLTGISLLEHLQDLYPGKYPNKHLRCLQDRVKKWKALHGPEKEVMFRQLHPPGLRGISDFTGLKTFQVTIQGKPFSHLLYHFRLTHSQWSWVKVVVGGESFTALAQGLQEALWCLGGSPAEHRTDSLSAAFKNLSQREKEDVTQRYESLCIHYGMEPTRNNRGRSHENGSIESPHGYLKRRLRHALALRGSYDFASIEDYQNFINIVVERHNQRHGVLIEAEKSFLKPLPAHKACDFEETMARVTTLSTITVKKNMYTVPSRLIGERLRVHIYDRHLSCYLGSEQVLDLLRIFSQKGGVKRRQVDYRHVIGSLARKPQAFKNCVYRDDLLPSPHYKEIWRLLELKCTVRQACKLIVGILKLAADGDCEKELGERVLKMLKRGIIPSLGDLQRRYELSYRKEPSKIPRLCIPKPSPALYNQFLSKLKEGASCLMS